MHVHTHMHAHTYTLTHTLTHTHIPPFQVLTVLLPDPHVSSPRAGDTNSRGVWGKPRRKSVQVIRLCQELCADRAPLSPSDADDVQPSEFGLPVSSQHGSKSSWTCLSLFTVAKYTDLKSVFTLDFFPTSPYNEMCMFTLLLSGCDLCRPPRPGGYGV